jgi:ethanolaminephosphotransferase
MSIFKKKYISPQGEKNLPSYKYSGSDASLLYKHVFSPTAQFCVDHLIPSWLAPNVITLLGFFCTLIPHLIIWVNYPDQLAGPVPSWLCILASVGQITYMTLDNADGKQARKTGSSSPLGLLFDHGCDAMNTFVSGLSLFTVIQLGNSTLALAGYIIAFSVFFMATWEEYYIESLNLPCFNGANEGIVGVAFFFLLSGIFGTSMWQYQIVSGVALNQLVVVFFVFVAIFTVYGNCKTVKNHTGTEKFGSAMSHLAVMVYLIVTCFITNALSNDIIGNSCRLFIYFIGFNFAKLVGIMQASHCAHVDFDQWRMSIIASTTFLNAHTITSYILGRVLISEKILITGLAIFAFLAYLHFAYNIIDQFTNVLKIRVFRISRPMEEKLTQDYQLGGPQGYAREGIFFQVLKDLFIRRRKIYRLDTSSNVDDSDGVSMGKEKSS